MCILHSLMEFVTKVYGKVNDLNRAHTCKQQWSTNVCLRYLFIYHAIFFLSLEMKSLIKRRTAFVPKKKVVEITRSPRTIMSCKINSTFVWWHKVAEQIRNARHYGTQSSSYRTIAVEGPGRDRIQPRAPHILLSGKRDFCFLSNNNYSQVQCSRTASSSTLRRLSGHFWGNWNADLLKVVKIKTIACHSPALLWLLRWTLPGL